MSHIVSIQSKVQDVVAIVAACHRLGLAAPVEGAAKLFSGAATGILVQLPGWNYPAVVDVASGEVRFDNYESSCLPSHRLTFRRPLTRSV
jgi:hypothetical protein